MRPADGVENPRRRLASGRGCASRSSGVASRHPGKHRPAAGQPRLAGAAQVEGVVAALQEQAEHLGAADHRERGRRRAPSASQACVQAWRRPDSTAPPCRSAGSRATPAMRRVRISRRRRAACGPPSPELRPCTSASAASQRVVEEALVGLELERVRLHAVRVRDHAVGGHDGEAFDDEAVDAIGRVTLRHDPCAPQRASCRANAKGRPPGPVGRPSQSCAACR